MKKLQLCLLGAFLAVSAPAQAATGGFNKFLEELKGHLDRAEEQRLADPWFLKDLRELVHKYEWPWQNRLLSDDFSGRGPQPDPPWRVTAGEFLLDWRYGMRSVVEPRYGSNSQNSEDPMKNLLGQILQEALSDPNKNDNQGNNRQADHAAVVAPIRITNSFVIEMELTARALQSNPNGRFGFGPYQGRGAEYGYRTIYYQGAQNGEASLAIIQITSRGSKAIETYKKPLVLEDGKPHKLRWMRKANGRMIVSVDGKDVMSVKDGTFREAFDGLVIANGGGDFALRQVIVDGTN